MSLVADYSDSDSDHSDNESPQPQVKAPSPRPAPKRPAAGGGLSALLPPPKKKQTASKPVFYVDLPSKASDDEEDDEDELQRKKRLKRSTSSGPSSDIADLLPAPKRSLNPFAKPKSTEDKPAPTARRPIKVMAAADVPDDNADDIEDAEPNASITSHDMPSTTTAAAAPSSASTYATAADAYAYHDYDPNAMYSAHTDPTAYYQYWQQHQQEEQKQQTATDQEIDEEVVAQLGGRSRAKGASIQIKSVNQADILPTEEWRAHANSLAPPQLVNAPNLTANNLQKKKNNIMALAAQAQTMQEQLEDQYANSRRAQQESRRKYGF